MRIRPVLLLGLINKEKIAFLTLDTKYDLEKPEEELKRMPKLNYAFTKLKHNKLRNFLIMNVLLFH
jgi:hypothetical protein